MGFRVLAIEADWSDCIAIDNYVTRGIGNAEKALCDVGYPHWKREEILDLINWMRAYNKTLPRANYENTCLHFCGLENTQPGYPENWLSEFLLKYCPNKDNSANRFKATDQISLSEERSIYISRAAYTVAFESKCRGAVVCS